MSGTYDEDYRAPCANCVSPLARYSLISQVPLDNKRSTTGVSELLLDWVGAAEVLNINLINISFFRQGRCRRKGIIYMRYAHVCENVTLRRGETEEPSLTVTMGLLGAAVDGYGWL